MSLYKNNIIIISIKQYYRYLQIQHHKHLYYITDISNIQH